MPGGWDPPSIDWHLCFSNLADPSVPAVARAYSSSAEAAPIDTSATVSIPATTSGTIPGGARLNSSGFLRPYNRVSHIIVRHERQAPSSKKRIDRFFVFARALPAVSRGSLLGDEIVNIHAESLRRFADDAIKGMHPDIRPSQLLARAFQLSSVELCPESLRRLASLVELPYSTAVHSGRRHWEDGLAGWCRAVST